MTFPRLVEGFFESLQVAHAGALAIRLDIALTTFFALF